MLPFREGIRHEFLTLILPSVPKLTISSDLQYRFSFHLVSNLNENKGQSTGFYLGLEFREKNVNDDYLKSAMHAKRTEIFLVHTLSILLKKKTPVSTETLC